MDNSRRDRRRRRAQQQSTCCCAAVVLLSLVFAGIIFRGAIGEFFGKERKRADIPEVVFPLQLETSAETYLRFNLVRFTAKVRDPRGNVVILDEPLELTVFHDDKVVTTVGGVESIKLHFDRNSDTYVGNWPIPWNPTTGVYKAETRITIRQPEVWNWETEREKQERLRRERQRREASSQLQVSGEAYCLATIRFEIIANEKPQLPPGTCVATWEPDFRATGIPKPEGGTGDWRTMLDWCEYIGADTFWFRGAVTEVYQGELTDETPFKTNNIQAISRMAAETRRRGLKFGAWAVAYSTYPRASNRRKPDYAFAMDISRSTGAITELEFISLLESKRVDHIAEFFAALQNDPNVDFVGLDYMRSDRGGYEMTERFTGDMPVKLPNNWDEMNQTKRWQHVATKVERDWQSDRNFYDSWNWWRAHIGAGNLQEMIRKSGLRKPLWIFVLSWWHGKQHGQDPIMFTDAGAAILAPMLYQVPNRGHFDRMVKDWNEYLEAGQANIMPGNQVDFYWHQKTLQPAAPEEMYDRMITAHRQYERGGNTMGAFLHDISRAAISGSRGPYPGTEWALAGGAAFSEVRKSWGVQPLEVELQMPKTAVIGGAFTGTLVIRNLSENEIRDLKVEILKTDGIEPSGNRIIAVRSLGGQQTVNVPVNVRIKGANAARANRFMTALAVNWPRGQYGEQFRDDLPCRIVVMQYVQGTK